MRGSIARSSTLSLILTLILSLAVQGGAAGQPKGKGGGGKVQEAKERYEAGKTAFRLRDFDGAIAEWSAGYKLHADAVFLFNIAQAYREKRDFENAISFYSSYLKESPEASNRDKVEQRIAEMKEAMQKQREAVEHPPSGPLQLPTTVDKPGSQEKDKPETAAAPPAGPSHPGSGLRTGGLILGVSGLVVAGVGVFLGLSAKSDESSVNDALAGGTPWSQDLADQESSAKNKALLSNVAIGTGAAALVGGVILYYVGMRKGHAVEVVPEASSRRVGLTVVMSW